MKRISALMTGLLFIAGTVGAATPQKAPTTTPAQKAVAPAQAPVQRETPRRHEPMKGKLGAGYAYQVGNFGNFALRYWSETNNGFEGLLGFCKDDNDTEFDLGGKVLGGLKKEQNMTVYMFGMFGLWKNSAKTETLFAGGLGAEFFLTGLPNLSLISEMGVRYRSDIKTFSTYGEWVPTVGMRYYYK